MFLNKIEKLIKEQKVVHIYTCHGRNNQNTLMYYCLAIIMGIYCLHLNDVLLLIKSLLSKYFSTVREYSSLAICKQQFK